MDIKKLVEYQKVDSKLFRLERTLAQSENKKKCIELSNIAKDSQNKSAKLEDQASQVAREIQDLFKVADQNKLRIKQIVSQDVNSLTQEQIESSLMIREKLVQNLQILDKKATKLAELANQILAEFNKTKVAYKNAGEKYKICKDAYDKEVAEINPEIEKVKKELSELEKSIDKADIEEYKKKRNDRIFPVLVPLNNKSCGGCHMEIPMSSLSKLDQNGFLVCENCRRIIYK